jgi:hypothetical protein
LRRGADAIAGRIEIDSVEAALIPPRLHEDDARECAYADLLDQIDAAITQNCPIRYRAILNIRAQVLPLLWLRTGTLAASLSLL